MSKSLYISEKPSVATEFSKALKESFKKYDGYMESESSVISWCVGHLVTMSYPEVYDPALKRWTIEPLPFLPKQFRYEVIPNVSKQFNIVKNLLHRKDIDRVYVCTDSGREGEYIYRLVDQLANVPKDKIKCRVWIDSQTEDEILRGIREAKPLSEYDHLSSAAYLRAKEDYLMGINFSRILTLKYGNRVNNFLGKEKRCAVSVGRVMTCVLGMVVRREREVREFLKTPFYRVLNTVSVSGGTFDGEFRAIDESRYYNSPLLYKENGFKKYEDAKELIHRILDREPNLSINEEGGKNSYGVLLDESEQIFAELITLEKKKENRNPPLLFNLAELQNECSKIFKISPDETLKMTQELYEKKLVTYPRTDARVLSTAVSKEINKNLMGLRDYIHGKEYAREILELGNYKNISNSRYVNDKQITDHYAIIPTGQGLGALHSLSPTSLKLYELIVRRFLSIFYPPAVYQKVSLVTKMKKECFFSNFKVLEKEGYLKVAKNSFDKRNSGSDEITSQNKNSSSDKEQSFEENDTKSLDADFMEVIKSLNIGMKLPVKSMTIKEGETAPPKRYNSGSMILAMENAGQLIDDEELRAQIKGSGIGTSATRAEILNKLVKIEYLSLNKKTQMITPTQLGEMIFDVVNFSIKSLLNAELTASWEKGLTYVSEGTISEAEYMEKLEGFVLRMTNGVKNLNNENQLQSQFQLVAKNYDK